LASRGFCTVCCLRSLPVTRYSNDTPRTWAIFTALSATGIDAFSRR
jgi:hypothetical protein